MITRSTHHLGLRAEDGRLCEASVQELHIVAAMLPYFSEQLVRRPQGAKPCTECLVMFWFAARDEREH